MGYGKLHKDLYPNRNEAYFCRVCTEWNYPFDYKNYKELLLNNVCPKCARAMNRKGLYE